MKIRLTMQYKSARLECDTLNVHLSNVELSYFLSFLDA